jgi:hypothetical protein
VVTIEVTEMPRSRREPSRIPASTPSPRETGTTTAIVARARIPVLPSLGHMMSPTGTLKRIEVPKSPTTKFASQSKYLRTKN